MDRKTILEKGLLLGYLLDELSVSDKRQVEKALLEDTVLRNEFQKLEADFERMSMENAIGPPMSVKEALKRSIESDEDRTLNKVRSISSKNAYNPMRLLVAASLAAIFALTSFWFYSQWQQAEERTILAIEEQRQIQEELQKLNMEMQEVRELYTLISDQDAIPLVLEGNSLAPQTRAVAYVNHRKRSVLVNTRALPQLSGEETYQMWADVDGEMINMGLVPTDQDLVSLTYIDRAESLNITIEPKGGSEHPTVERLISNVYL